MSIYESLYPFQKNIVDRFKNRPTFGLFLDMGLGKTPTSLAFAEVNNCTKVLVVTINAKACESETTRGSWLNWASQSNISYLLNGKYSSKTFCETENDIFVVNYESLFKRTKSHAGLQLSDKIVNFIQSCKNNNAALIVDESHKVKNLQTSQTKSIQKIQLMLQKTCKKLYTYLLTGTPFTTGYIDLYAQLKLLGWSGSKSMFVDAFCILDNRPGLLGWQQPIVGYKNIEALFALIHRFAITVDSDSVVELPEQIFVDHELPISLEFIALCSEQLKTSMIAKMCERQSLIEESYEYTTLKDKKVNNPFYRNLAYPEWKWLAETSGTFWLRAREASIGFQGNASDYKWYNTQRLKALKTFLEDNPSNYILFYNYTPELLELYDICEELGYKIDVYCGEIKSLLYYEQYERLSDAQKLTDTKRIILANFASGATGMNWQEYNHVIIFSTPLYKDYRQAIKRIHRLGQKQTVFYHSFYQDNWLDKGMRKALQDGIDYSNDMFNSDLIRIQSLMEDDDK